MSEPQTQAHLNLALFNLFACLHKTCSDEDFKRMWDKYATEGLLDVLSIKRMCALFYLAGKAFENKDLSVGELLNDTFTPKS